MVLLTDESSMPSWRWIEDQRIALDERVALPRPRSRGNPAFAALEEQVLERVLGQGRRA